MKDSHVIKRLPLSVAMNERFSRYTKSIIQQRAIPDVRDGLKPVQRRILFAMEEDGNTADKAYRKSAKAVGNVMGNFHPHGDSSIYGALIFLSQPWKMRLPLIDLHGNNGSIDDDPPAAMRYTEARLSKASNEMLRDLKKGTVTWALNFDDTKYEPTVLPSRFPNLIVNGSMGISSGFATNIPPHNLGEVTDALIYLQAHPDASLDKLMHFIKGPDFPTGGIVQGLDGLRKAYSTGKGKVVLRSRTKIIKIRGGKKQIRVSEIPYGVNKLHLVHEIRAIQLDHKINGIAQVEDDSDRHGLMITITLKQGADAEGTLGYLFKNTALQTNYHFNVVAIDQEQPKLLSLKAILMDYLEFQRRIIYNRTKFDLGKIHQRQEIVHGYIKALSMIDKIVKAIRHAHGRADASRTLVNDFGFTPNQANAIVALRLYRLTNTDHQALKDEDRFLNAKADFCKSILNDRGVLDTVLRHEMLQIKKKYNTPRRTTIEAKVSKLQISKKVTVPDEDVVATVTHDGYVKRSSWRSYNASKPGQNGLKPGDYPLFTQRTNTRNHLLIFTDRGRVIYRPVNDIKEVRWKETGQNISQSIKMLPHEHLRFCFSFKNLKQNGQFMIETSDGYIKRTPFKDIMPGRTYRHHAPEYVNLKHKNARVVNVIYLPKDMSGYDILLMSQGGFALRFKPDEVTVNGSNAAGVRSMNLNESDHVVSMQLVRPDDDILVITSKGIVSRFHASNAPLLKRNGKGNHIVYHTKLKWPKVVSCLVANPYDAHCEMHVYTKFRREAEFDANQVKQTLPGHKGQKMVNVAKLTEPTDMRY